MNRYSVLWILAVVSLPVTGMAQRVKATANGWAVSFPGVVPHEKTVTGAAFSAHEVSNFVAPHPPLTPGGGSAAQPQADRTLYRDSLGRTREEWPIKPPVIGNGAVVSAPRLVAITDPVAGFQYILDEQHQVAHRLKLPAAGPVQRSQPPTSQAIIFNGASMEQLGQQQVLGVTATGTRITSKDSSRITESWDAIGLQLKVLSKVTSLIGVETVQVDSLTVGSPDPALFFVPAEYQVIDEGGPFTISYPRP